MDYHESTGNILHVPQGYYLAHCISGDFTLGAGLAKEIDENYDMKEKLQSFYNISDDQHNYVGKALLVDNVFNLVTKQFYWDKASYDNLQSALQDMAEQMDELHIKKLAIPHLGCGKDHLDWEVVQEMIEEIFGEKDIYLLVLDFALSFK